MTFIDYGNKNISFVKQIVDEIIKTYISSLRMKLSFTPKLEQLVVDIYETANLPSTGNCNSDSLLGEITITLDINSRDSKKFIAFVIAHEFAHFLFINPYDMYGFSGKASDGTTNFTAVQRFLANQDTYGYYFEELLANYLAHFIVAKLNYEDTNEQYKNAYELDKIKHKMVYILETTFGKSIEESDFIDQIVTSKSDEINHNFFWDCIIAFSLNNIIDIYDDIMGKDEFHLLCDLIDKYCENDYNGFNAEEQENKILNKLSTFSHNQKETTKKEAVILA